MSRRTKAPYCCSIPPNRRPAWRNRRRGRGARSRWPYRAVGPSRLPAPRPARAENRSPHHGAVQIDFETGAVEDDAIGQVADEEFRERILFAQPLVAVERHQVFEIAAKMMSVMNGGADHRRGAAMGRPPAQRIGIFDACWKEGIPSFSLTGSGGNLRLAARFFNQRVNGGGSLFCSIERLRRPFISQATRTTRGIPALAMMREVRAWQPAGGTKRLPLRRHA